MEYVTEEYTGDGTKTFLAIYDEFPDDAKYYPFSGEGSSPQEAVNNLKKAIKSNIRFVSHLGK